jgi:hypothetical protein
MLELALGQQPLARRPEHDLHVLALAAADRRALESRSQANR